MEQEFTCLICFSSIDNPPILECSCTYCEDCLLNWIRDKVKDENMNPNNTEIVCPNHECLKKYKVDHLAKTLSQNGYNIIDYELFQNYLKSTQDIRGCPNTRCKYYGIILKKPCDSPLICEMCGFEWFDKENYTRRRRILEGIKNCFSMENEIFSTIYEEIFTVACPGCEINIIRNGGCPHMTCKLCCFEFCWYCKQKYQTHKFDLCTAHVFIQLIIFGIIMFNIFYKLGIVVFFFRVLPYVLFTIFKYAILLNMMFVLLFFSFYTFWKGLGRSKTLWENISTSAICIFTFFYVAAVYYYGYLRDSIYFVIAEVICVLIIWPMINLANIAYYSWLREVE
jgi:ariadne-1